MSKTIVAASTPIGGAVAMIRMSGKKAREITEKLCGKKLKKERMAYYVTVDTGIIKDKCVAVIYEEGKSYTGEESAEIYCHGSKIIVNEILKFAVSKGAEIAERGEFTLRAYQNKKIDLTEAEGIIDLINSETVEQAVNAYKSADGELKNQISDIQNELKKIIASIEVAIDYPEENIEEETINVSKEKILILIDKINKLTGSYDDGIKIKEGIKIVITGKPNVGKSSLFNSLLGYKRAIVNKEEGTTRDVIESEYIYKGRKFVISDTAGIRNTKNEAEQEGINLAKHEIQKADIVLGVGVAEDEYKEELKNFISVTNKCDIKRGINFNVSAKTNEGIVELKECIYRRTDFKSSELKINNLRQYQALLKTKECLLMAEKNTLTADCFAADLTEAYDSLGKITGVIGSDEIIAEIFSTFCVGK